MSKQMLKIKWFLSFHEPVCLNFISTSGKESSTFFFILQGIGFLDFYYYTFFKRSFEGIRVDSEIKQWLKMLLQLVNVTGQCPADHFDLFINGDEPVLQKYHHTSEEFVSELN